MCRGNGWKLKKRAVLICLLAVLACASICMSGCKDSDALKKIVYDQLSENVDHDSEVKFYLSDDTSSQKSDKVSAFETSDSATSSKEVQNLVVYSSTPNASKYTTKKSLWDPNPSFTGLEASSAVSFYKSDDPNAPKELAADTQEQEEEQESQEEDGATADDSKAGNLVSSTSKNTKVQDAPEASGDGGTEKVAEDKGTSGETKSDKGSGSDDSEDGDNDDGDKSMEVDTTDPTQEAPKVNSIAAYGDIAVLVQMVGGEGALAAADADLLSSKFKKVFDKEGAGSIKTGWSGSGGDGAADVDAIVSSGADCVLVLSESELTKSQRTKLKNNNVKIVTMYRMSNTKYVKKNVQTIGDMLAESTELKSGLDPADMAQQYVDFVKGLLEDACATANGGKKTLAGNETFELKNTTEYEYDADGCSYTLLLDEYDEDAKFLDDINGWTPVTDGVFLSQLGYRNRATSFYMQAGGLVNNAAFKGADTTGLYIAHQFNANTGTFDKTCFSKTDLIGKSLTREELGSGWDSTLFCVDTGDTSDTSISNLSLNFGTERFPRVIVTSEEAKEALVENSADPDGFYHPYGLTKSSIGGFFGKQTSGGSSVISCIGVPESDSTNLFATGEDAAAIPEENVEVNPTGLFSSWTDGTSAEAVLEAAWICDVVNIGCDKTSTGWKNYVKDFYSTFYRYSITDSEIAAMEEGE